MGAICNTDSKSKPRVISAPIEEFSRRPSNNINTIKNDFVDRKSNFREHYIINDILVSTPYTKIYKVLHRETNELRAMKTIKKQYFNSSIDEEKYILYELETLSTMEHPNILKVFEYFNDFEHLYIITEMFKGEDLYKRIPNYEFFSEFEAANIMEQLFSAIFYMHSKGILHRELRPENIFLESKEDDSKIINLFKFGLAAYCEKNARISKCKEASYFMAPEVFDDNYTYKTDLWSCGVILYILLIGVPPFDGKDYNELKENIKNCKVSMDSKAWNDISKEAKNLITSLLRVDPAKRISAEEAWKGTWIKKFTKIRKSNVSVKNKLNLDDFRIFANKEGFLDSIYVFLLYQSSLNDMIKDLSNIFKNYNKSSNYKLSYAEFKEGLKKYYGDDMTENEIELYLKEHNLEKDKSLIFEEFLIELNDRNQLLITKNFKHAFDIYNFDGKGKITIDEIKQILKIDTFEVKNERNVIINLIKEIEKQTKDFFSFEEFKELIIKLVKSNF